MGRLAGALALAAALGGCAVRERAPASPERGAGVPAEKISADVPLDATERRAAADLAGTLVRVDAVAPARVPGVRLIRHPAEPGFARALEAALREAGYAIVPGADADEAERTPRVGYTVRRGVVGGAPVVTWTVTLADVRARRTWTRAGGPDGSDEGRDGWVPAGPLYVRGADVAGLGPSGSAAASAAADPTSPASAIASTRVAVDPATGLPVYDAPALGRLGAGRFAGYADVAERTLVFGADSVRLGTDNEAIVAAVAQRFEPASDVFSIVGCPPGRTTASDGDERLALERADRVRRELVQLGVPSGRVVDAGCGAVRSVTGVPRRRGVVLTLLRRDA